ncbi:sulfonate ABC transporter permease [Pandoraea pneumonica]|uniref:Sulfonate ABC transporter permease n=1 Tax=Pandoraea pneumonica TaxID=2508299 RepID=A0A5E4VU31_9BURK|nr:ABC transporter permease [Pandoraea pneumonica]VVE14774.1 sulfonate ABC transporter permease [Pandoraea pneumonica]
MKKRIQRKTNELWGVTFGFIAFLLISWEFASRRLGAPEYLLGPWEIVGATFSSITQTDVLEQSGQSLARIFTGFLIGSSIGVLLGLLSGVSRGVRDFFDVPQSFLHAVPKISLFPAIALWLGFSDASRILVIALSCFFPAYLSSMSGALGMNPRYLWLAKNNEIGRIKTFTQVVLPASLPRTMVGLRISLMVGFILMVSTEVVGHASGVGAAVMLSYQDGDYRNMYSGILIIALMGFFSNLALTRLSNWLCRGHNLDFGA